MSLRVCILCVHMCTCHRWCPYRKGLGECVCQKVTQSAHHAETAQTSSVLRGASVCVCLCVGVSEWNWIKGRGGSSERGNSEGKSHWGLHQSFQFLRSPPLCECYIVKAKTGKGLSSWSCHCTTLWKVSALWFFFQSEIKIFAIHKI